MKIKPKNDVECNEMYDTTMTKTEILNPDNRPEIDCSECRDKNICVWEH